ncbi:hypothetical protein [Hyalangium minutum]|nr:hypothetical protein [Hyalangium minutum]
MSDQQELSRMPAQPDGNSAMPKRDPTSSMSSRDPNPSLPTPPGGGSGGGSPPGGGGSGGGSPPGGGGSGGGFQLGNWGSFKADKCTGIGLRQKSAILWGIQGSWEQACYRAGAIIDGYAFSHPARCQNTSFNMWGEFDVPDESCRPYWGDFKADSCTGVGVRQFSSVLYNIKDIKWEDACWQMPALIQGVQFERPNRCRIAGQHMWGEFDVPDSSCGPIYPD